MTIVGLWLTPFLLGRIGTHDYGLWLVTTQILGYLQLLDLGVVALAPREVAYATGRALQGAEGASVAETVARFRRVVAWQVPATAIIAAVCWWAVASRWPELRAPLAVIVIAFVAAFPLRLFHATLQGLQDLAFLGRVQLWSWLCGTTVTDRAGIARQSGSGPLRRAGSSRRPSRPSPAASGCGDTLPRRGTRGERRFPGATRVS